MSGHEIQRRLATIVAIDAAGYSRQSEVDEAVAVREVAALGDRIAASAAAHGGRVFNSAGDGFMLEFTAASSAIACVDELLSSARLPLRAGAHLDEVSVMANGDLLGRGVNVAARLQALAKPGELIASGELQRALQGGLRDRLQRRGSVKLDKMEAEVETYALAIPWGGAPAAPRASFALPPRRWIVGAAAAVVLALVAGAGYFALRQPADPTIAVLPFDPRYADPDAQFFADGVASSVATALAEIGMPVVSQTQSFRYRGDARADAARELGAAFVVHGDVAREGENMRISVRVEDARAGVTVLAKDFEAPIDDDARIVREQIAADIAGALSWGGGAASGLAWSGAPDAEIAAGVFRIRQQLAVYDRTGAYETARGLARAAPNNARAQSLLAHATAFALRTIRPEDRSAAIQAAREAARRAVRLDPSLGDAYAAMMMLTPPYLWTERATLLRRAVDVDPESSVPASYLGGLWRASGYLDDAEQELARAAALDPLWANVIGEQVDVLVALGRHAEARQILERAARLWPQRHDIIFSRFDAAIAMGDIDEAEALLRDRTTRSVIESADGPSTHRPLVRALRSRSRGDTQALARVCADAAAITRNGAYNCMVGLSSLGEVDATFALASQMFPDQRGATPEAIEQRWLDTAATLHASGVLFLPQTATMRADPRFAALAARLGLFQYWRERGRRPDFCATEHAPVCAQLAR